MKTANIPLYENIAVYKIIVLSVYMLRIHSFSIFTIKTPLGLAALAPLVLLIMKTQTAVL